MIDTTYHPSAKYSRDTYVQVKQNTKLIIILNFLFMNIFYSGQDFRGWTTKKSIGHITFCVSGRKKETKSKLLGQFSTVSPDIEVQ